MAWFVRALVCALEVVVVDPERYDSRKEMERKPEKARKMKTKFA